ncbi:MAG: MarR family transcriptional regulator, partial [Chloroflexi bacterium]|nr:MarR family transcriptional regulator [Chloroflexota bacterium]
SMIEETERKQTQAMIDAQVEEFSTAFAKLRQVMKADFKHAHQHGMSATQFMVLKVMEEAQDSEPCTISSLAGRLDLDPATVVRTVDSLENRRLVARRRDKQDRRQVFVEFTEAGLAALQEQRQRFYARITVIFTAMSEEGRASLLMGFQEFVRVGQQEQ